MTEIEEKVKKCLQILSPQIKNQAGESVFNETLYQMRLYQRVREGMGRCLENSQSNAAAFTYHHHQDAVAVTVNIIEKNASGVNI